MWHYVEVSGQLNVPVSLPLVKETQQGKNISDLIICKSKQYLAACNWQHHKAFLV